MNNADYELDAEPSNSANRASGLEGPTPPRNQTNGLHPSPSSNGPDLRTRLVALALEWQVRFGIAPAITCAISEYDAAIPVGCTDYDYCVGQKLRMAVPPTTTSFSKVPGTRLRQTVPAGKREASLPKPANRGIIIGIISFGCFTIAITSCRNPGNGASKSIRPASRIETEFPRGTCEKAHNCFQRRGIPSVRLRMKTRVYFAFANPLPQSHNKRAKD
jgi:hypothetical protein